MPVQVQGDFYVQVPAAVTKGQKVFVNNTTGALAGGTAGGTVASSTETDWAFATSADANEIAIITNYGATPAVSSGGGAALKTKSVEVVTDVTGQDDTVSVTKDNVTVIDQ